MLRLYFICKTIPSNPSKYLGSPLVEWKLGNRISDVCWALETKARERLILSLPSKGVLYISKIHLIAFCRLFKSTQHYLPRGQPFHETPKLGERRVLSEVAIQVAPPSQTFWLVSPRPFTYTSRFTLRKLREPRGSTGPSLC